MNAEALQWWSNLLHGGMLVDLERLDRLITPPPDLMLAYQVDHLRREMAAFLADPAGKRNGFVAFVLETACGFTPPGGAWHRGTRIDASWTVRGPANETIRPGQLWVGPHQSLLPVFLDDARRIGLGHGRRLHSHALQWLRATGNSLALVTNGQQWRLIFAGLDFDAFVEWDLGQWFSEGETSDEFAGFRALVNPRLWHSPQPGAACPLLAATRDSRKGQSDLSKVLGERVRQAAEHLIQAHSPALAGRQDLPPADIYRGAVRMIMRLVVVLFAESREGLLPRDNTVYYSAYSLNGLRELLERTSPHRLADTYAAWPRIISLFRLIHGGSRHEVMPVPAYGGELFAPGPADNTDGMSRVLNLFEMACFNQSLMSDLDVRRVLDLLTRTRIKIRVGRSSTWMPAPVDFSSLDSEYIGILYEGLLDFDLRCAAPDEPIVFLAVGNEPALPLSTLEQMDDAAIKNLLEKLKDTSSGDDDGSAEEDSDEAAEVEEEAGGDTATDEAEEEAAAAEPAEVQDEADAHYTLQARAERWARRVCEVANLVARPRGRMTPERQMQYDRALAAKARQLVIKVVLPGEWYLVRWGGTRKGSGTFYTRPPLAVPTVHRTLRPLAYDPPPGADGRPNTMAPPHEWKVKTPEAILSLKVCDPACGSGSFDLAALRFLTQALFESMQAHGRFRQHNGRDIMDLIMDSQGRESLVNEALPCRPDDDDFERRVKAILRRYVVERCIYGVDLDPLAVELCRLSLWIETLDRSLPLTFLNHKIKVGNSLVGAWFDQFLHYPAMAWEREGGDKNHTNGVHHPKETRTKAIKAFAREVRADLIRFIDGSQLFYPVDLTTVRTGHDAAEAALKEIHALRITEVDQRAEKYEALRASPEFQRLQHAFDLWCALWFWPADLLNAAPLPTQFAEGRLSDTGWQTVRGLAEQHRFFHWELEFPDVFNSGSRGFSALMGNPPWDISKPNSKEFFSAFDPLYRSYGKQEAVGMQRGYFQREEAIERQWLDYNARFKGMSNWVKYAGLPFGDRVRWKEDEDTGKKTPKHDLNLGDRGRNSFYSSQRRHDQWKQKREESSGYADADHSFRHQGSADVNLYKLFLEQAHALLAEGGRLGFVVPSGLYSDFGTGDLRRLFLDGCRWEWLFGFENREGIFDIDSRFKFNPIIVAKGGQTLAIRTAFMRRNLADWEHGEQFATDYTREQVVQFSPNSRAILEIQSQRDLEVLTKIYANSVLLGDQSERGWGIKYATEFHMTNDSKLFPPRPKWEEWGYQPDEYSRWIKGEWRPIEELYAELGVRPLPEGERRCAQPPYDKLPIPRADIPAGIILSREATHFIRESDIPVVKFTDAAGRPLRIKIENEDGEKEEIEVQGPAIALPLYEGRMIGQFDFSEKGWVSGKGRSAEWRDIPWDHKQIEPQFLMARSAWLVGQDPYSCWPARLGFMDVTSATNSRTLIAAITAGCPSGNKVPVLTPGTPRARDPLFTLNGVMNTFAFDFSLRRRLGGTTLNWFIAEETAVPSPVSSGGFPGVAMTAAALASPSMLFAPVWLGLEPRLGNAANLQRLWDLTPSRRMEGRAALDAMAAALFGLTSEDLCHILAGCDVPREQIGEIWHEPKGFWRVGKADHPEYRHTVLSIVAFRDLQQKIDACDGDLAKGIDAFCNQNDGEGWMLPETLRLADYGLGHDDRAKEHQPVRECFGPRFYDWQLAQPPEESWRECHLHARNLLGAEAYQRLVDEIEGKAQPVRDETDVRSGQLFDYEAFPLFQQKKA